MNPAKGTDEMASSLNLLFVKEIYFMKRNKKKTATDL